MIIVRRLAWAMLVLVFVGSLGAGLLSRNGYQSQFRDQADAAPSRQFPLGTDDLGRDRFARLLYGSRVSLALAPAAALLTTAIAALVGGLAGLAGGWLARFANFGIDLMLSLPWLFLIVTVRAMLPLDTSPLFSAAITFGLLGSLGWAAAARVASSAARSLRESDHVLQARAAGCSPWRILMLQIAPNLKPILYAQFWISIPLFVASEANLGVLGLGVVEPMPSWGGLLRELETAPSLSQQPWLATPILLLVVVVACLHLVLAGKEATA